MEFIEALRQQPLYILWLYLLIINLTSFFAMGIDKYKAVHKKWRISEKTLFTLAYIGGGIGGICGIYAFHHKTMQKKFTVGFPAITAVQAAVGALMFTGILK